MKFNQFLCFLKWRSAEPKKRGPFLQKKGSKIVIKKKSSSPNHIHFFFKLGRVDDLATELGRTMTSIAIGSEEGFTQADKAINTASKNGRWVLLKNVHLAPSWLVTLEKKLHSMSVHSAFRLFLTCEITPKVF